MSLGARPLDDIFGQPLRRMQFPGAIGRFAIWEPNSPTSETWGTNDTLLTQDPANELVDLRQLAPNVEQLHRHNVRSLPANTLASSRGQRRGLMVGFVAMDKTSRGGWIWSRFMLASS